LWILNISLGVVDVVAVVVVVVVNVIGVSKLLLLLCVNFINVFHTNVISAAFLVTCKSCRNIRSYKKFVRLTLMKLTIGITHCLKKVRINFDHSIVTLYYFLRTSSLHRQLTLIGCLKCVNRICPLENCMNLSLRLIVNFRWDVTLTKEKLLSITWENCYWFLIRVQIPFYSSVTN